MLLTGKILKILNSGAPDYDICGRSTTGLSLSNLSFKLCIGKNNAVTYTVIDTNDLSTLVTSGIPVTYTYGNYDIVIDDFVYDTGSSMFQLDVKIYFTGTSDVVTWERLNVFIFISKTGYQPFSNTFEFYNYDVGNSSSISGLTDTTGNTDFEIILTEDANNLDAFDRQTKVASNFMAIRRPFTKEIHIYNMIGTQGEKSYSDANGVIGYGDKMVHKEEEDVLITQTIDLPATYCTSSQMVYKKVWWPLITYNYSSSDTCDNCANDVAETEVTYSIDATLLSVFNINGTPRFLTEFMDHKIVIEIINYKSEITNTDSFTTALTYADWTSDPTPFLNPVSYPFVPSSVGINVIKITSLFYYDTTVDIKLYECVSNYSLSTCHWWTITATDNCGGYTLNNCSERSITVLIQKMNDDKVFVDLSVAGDVVAAGDSLDITLSTDGIYVIKVSYVNDDEETIIEYYTLPSFCGLKDCLLKFLKIILCATPTGDNCKAEDWYDFNALLITAHSFFIALNKEMKDTYIYESIDSDKIDELYVLKQFIDRMDEYCGNSSSPCVPCSQ